MDKNKLIQYIQKGFTIREISSKTNKSYTAVRHWLKKYQISTIHKRRIPISCSAEEFKKIVDRNISIAGIIRDLKRALVGSNYAAVYKEINRLGLSTEHLKGRQHGTSGAKQRLPWSEFLTANSSHKITSQIKKRLIGDGLLENKCQICKMPPLWQDKYLVLRLDHANGIRNDNRSENLRLVCPNCDSQLPTFCGKNKCPPNG